MGWGLLILTIVIMALCEFWPAVAVLCAVAVVSWLYLRVVTTNRYDRDMARQRMRKGRR